MPTPRRSSKTSNTKSKAAQVRLTPDQFARFSAAARREHRKLADWLRVAAEAYLDRSGNRS